MGRQIITIQIGQGGIQIGNALWELYCMEHGITATGHLNNDISLTSTNRIDSLFYDTRDGRCIPRSIFMDLEPTVVDEIRSGSYRDLFNPLCLISGKEDAASNYARGFYNLGKLHIENFMNAIRKMANNCDHLSLFEILNTYDGGTGSGMTSLLLERLSDDFSKKFRFETGIFPSCTMSELPVGPYNSLLFTHSTFETLDCGILVDNESIYTRLCDQLQCEKPTFTMINRFISQMLSCVFLSHRYNCQGSQHIDVDELMTNAVPYPRIHFPVLSYAPIVSPSQINHEITKPQDLVREIFVTNSHFLNCPMQLTKYISCCLMFRGSVSPNDVYEAVSMVKSDDRVQFVDWCPTGFKIGINCQPSLSTPNGILAAANVSLCMLSGNVGIKEAWTCLRNKYQQLFSKKAFLHWFIGEGLEENDFSEANEDIQVLEKDYEEISRDSESTTEVEIKTVPSTKNNLNNNFNNNFILSPSKSITRSKLMPLKSGGTQSYSTRLYEDVVLRLDKKMTSSNKKMIKKLDKLQLHLNQINQIYSEHGPFEKYDDRGFSGNNFKNSFRERKRTATGNIDFYKHLIRMEKMGNLDFSTKEHIICAQTGHSKDYDTSQVTIDSSGQRSVTTKVTSEPSISI